MSAVASGQLRSYIASVPASPVAPATPDLAAEESVGTDASLDDKAGSAVAPALVASTAEPSPRQESDGTYPVEESREGRTCSGRGPESTNPEASPQDDGLTPAGTAATHPDDDWPEMPAFLARTEQGRG